MLGAGSSFVSDVHFSFSGIVNGPWSDASAEWTDRMKHKLKHVPYYIRGVLCGFTFLSFIFS